ncbi:MAG: hypothetical protein SGI71_00380 [Verrucomicrobiota bacterium]|nr:hypothetical protein [Verrucomicrobiota bacterium]
MSNPLHETKLVEERFDVTRHCSGVIGFLIAGIIAAIVALLFVKFGPGTAAQLGRSWLWACSIAITICAGSLFWVLLHHASNAAWSTVIRRLAENVASLFLVLAVLFIPAMFVLGKYLYEWMTIDPSNKYYSLFAAKKSYYYLLSYNYPDFFYFRLFFYFVVFGLVAYLVKALSTRQDVTGDLNISLKLRRIACAALPFFGLGITFWSIDYLMGLDFKWYSTMFGVYIFAGSAGSSMAVLIILLTWLRSKGHMTSITNSEHYHIMGKLLFAFTVFWGYIVFSQYFLIWYANIPEETTFYRFRNEGFLSNRDGGFWRYFTIIFIVLGHFFVPFILLLTQWIKRKPAMLVSVAVWVLVMHAIDLYWLIFPKPYYNSIASFLCLSLLDVLCLVSVFGILAFFFLRSLGNHSLIPIKDPRLLESINLKN